MYQIAKYQRRKNKSFFIFASHASQLTHLYVAFGFMVSFFCFHMHTNRAVFFFHFLYFSTISTASEDMCWFRNHRMYNILTINIHGKTHVLLLSASDVILLVFHSSLIVVRCERLTRRIFSPES